MYASNDDLRHAAIVAPVRRIIHPYTGFSLGGARLNLSVVRHGRLFVMDSLTDEAARECVEHASLSDLWGAKTTDGEETFVNVFAVLVETRLKFFVDFDAEKAIIDRAPRAIGLGNVKGGDCVMSDALWERHYRHLAERGVQMHNERGLDGLSDHAKTCAFVPSTETPLLAPDPAFVRYVSAYFVDKTPLEIRKHMCVACALQYARLCGDFLSAPV
jgi:hypothetical protein